MTALVDFPICHSITGNGMRQTLAIAQRHIPLGVKEAPSGTPVLEWTVPREWNISGAYIACRDGPRIADFTTNDLRVLQYSTPIDALIPLTSCAHIYILCRIRRIGFSHRTRRKLGFCLTHRQLSSLTDGLYRVVIDSDLRPATLAMASC